MFRIIFIILILSSTVWAQGRIIIPDPEIPRDSWIIPIELVKVQATIDIQKDVANIKLQQHFRNNGSRILEGEYIYSLPGISQIDDFYLWVNGKKIKGQLLDSKQARSIYEDIVRRQRDPALLEYADYGLFKAHIFPIQPKQERQIALNYSQVVEYESGHYKFELPIRQSGQGLIDEYNISIALKGNEGFANIYSPSHKIEIERQNSQHVTIKFQGKQVDGSKNFTLFYAISDKEINGSLLSFRPRTDRDGYFMFFANPAFGTVNKKAISKDVIFVIDVSGSMGGEKIDQARDALRFCLNVLNKDDRFEIIRFNGAVQGFAGKLQEANHENIQNALYFIDNITANGGTNINDALLKALSIKKRPDQRPTSIVFLTDGLPTEGVKDIKNIVQNVLQNQNNFIRLFNFGVGYDVNTWLLDKLAQESNGSVTYVKPGEDIESAISALITKISSPLLTETEIAFNGIEVYDIYPQKLPDIFKGQRIMVTGRYRHSGKAKLVLSGLENGRKKEFSYTINFTKRDSENEFIAKLWANRKVNYLLNKIRFEGENDEWVQSVKNIAEEFGIVTPYTSYLVKEQNEELASAESRRDLLPVAAKMKKRQEAMEAKGMGGVAYEALSSSVTIDAQKSSGFKSVMGSSKRQDALKEAEQDEAMLFTHKNIAGKAFQFKDGFWQERGLDKDSDNIKTIKFMSEEYKLLTKKHKDLHKILALGTDVFFEWQGKIYKIEK